MLSGPNQHHPLWNINLISDPNDTPFARMIDDGYESFLSELESTLTKSAALTCYVANISTYGNQVSLFPARAV